MVMFAADIPLAIVACGGPRQAQGAALHVSGADARNTLKANPRGERNARVAPAPAPPAGSADGCPVGSVSIEGQFCIDRYEASIVEMLPNMDEVPWSPYLPVKGHVVRAVSQPNVVPQGYISATEAQQACRRSGKRLCKASEWKKACMGPEHTTWGYGNAHVSGQCNDDGRSPVIAMFGLPSARGWNWSRMNDPQLNQMSNTLDKTGEHRGCTNGYGVYDMVGNLHEWVADSGGTFNGGYYQDTHQHGDGCTYTTIAHSASYHDYSTGFRCCADPSR